MIVSNRYIQTCQKRDIYSNETLYGKHPFRENQMLKQQLKKYVTVVQQLRRDDRIPSDHDLSSGNFDLTLVADMLPW